MLQFRGNLLDAKDDIIVHQVNCQGKMNSGIAKQIREKWPIVFARYNTSNKQLGNIQFVKVEEDKHVCNLFSQLDYGYDGKKYTNYEAIYIGLMKIKEAAQERGLSVAIPYNMGCDRGGASWKIVCAMIEVIFEDYEVHIYRL
jgi:O-acetyl-ADP-ribose deacetylase (regulator of RNase III)